MADIARTMIYRKHIISLIAVCFVALLFGKCEMTMGVYEGKSND